MRARIARFVIQFALVYGAFVWLASLLPVYPWIERAVAAFVDLTLLPFDTADTSRDLWVEARNQRWVYHYRVEIQGTQRMLGGPVHAHGFILLLFVGLAIATPGLAWRSRLCSLLGGAALTFALCAGMLMSDVQRFEGQAFTREPRSSGPYPALVSLMDGVHRTAAGALIPLVLWAFFAVRPLSAQDSRS